jgi:hypothetical protein
MTEYETHGWTTSTLNPDDYEVKKSEVTEEKPVNMKNPDMVSHPRHYNREGAMECIDEMELIFGPEMTMHFCLGCVFKYRYRAGLKNNGYEDLEKSDWYMNKYKELKEKVEASKTITTQPINPWTITPMVTPTTTPNWWENPNYTITCNTNTTVASK